MQDTATKPVSAAVELKDARLFREAEKDASGKMTAIDMCGQNHRSLINTVSPGLIGVPKGTTARYDPSTVVWVNVTSSRLARGEKPPAMAMALSTLIFGTYGYWPGAATSPRMKNGR